MPNLRRLIEELTELGTDPSEIQLPGTLYDTLLKQVESEDDEDEQE
ncbi:hypothetical protein ACFLUY_01185 [Chloroflexota bacterium]